MSTLNKELDRQLNIEEAEREDEHWDMIIQPKSSMLDLQLKEVWKYKDLMMLFVKRDFVSQFKQTVLGPLWYVIQPMLTTLMFVLIFGRIAKISTEGINPIVFYMSGITIWNYFATCLTSTSTTFVTNASIFGKVYFPRLVLPLSIIISSMIRFGIQFLLLLFFMIFFSFKGFPFTISANWLYLPVFVLLMAGMGLGLGIIISSVTTKYRDFSVLLTFAVQLGMYVTPIAYPLSYLKDGSMARKIIMYNPLTGIVEGFRYCLFGSGTITTASLLYSALFMISVLFLGIILFNKVEKSFMDTV